VATKSKKDLLVENAILAPLDWVDERTAAVRGTKWFLFRNVPRDVSWAQTLGSAALTAFIVLAVTGVILAMYYEPSATIDPVSGKSVACTSIESITNELTLGWLVRGMHRWGASVFIILLFLHMGRVFLFGAYKYPRELTWITGVLGPDGLLGDRCRDQPERDGALRRALARAISRGRTRDRVHRVGKVLRLAHARDPRSVDRADRRAHLPRHPPRRLLAAMVGRGGRP